MVSVLGSTSGSALRPELAKINVIHFTTTDRKRPPHGDTDDPASHGYFCTWNPTTGVLTAAISQPDGPNSTTYDQAFASWIIRNVK